MPFRFKVCVRGWITLMDPNCNVPDYMHDKHLGSDKVRFSFSFRYYLLPGCVSRSLFLHTAVSLEVLHDTISPYSYVYRMSLHRYIFRMSVDMHSYTYWDIETLAVFGKTTNLCPTPGSLRQHHTLHRQLHTTCLYRWK